MRFFVLLLVAAVVFIASCKKVETPAVKEDLLKVGKWRMHQILKKNRLIDNKFYIDTVNINGLDECKQDDYLQFMEANKGTLKTGEKKCQGEVEQINFRWGITDNYTRMYIYDAGEMFDGNNNITGDLKDIVDTSFTLEYMTYANTFITVDGKTTTKVDTTWYTTTVRKRG